MKKKTILSALVLALISIFLVACKSSTASNPVKDFMKACVDRDSKTVEQMIQYAGFKNEDTDKVMEEVSGMVKDMGGVDSMETKAYSKDDLKEDIAKTCENKAGEDFRVVECSGNNKHCSWLVKKMDGKYYIIDVEESSVKEILK